MKTPQHWFLALILLLTACGSAERTEPSPLSESNTAEAEQVEPVNIGVALDNSRAVSAVIPITGGSLTATSADGTTYTLEIPGDALLNETEITMTPVESLSGMPFGSEPTLAVQLEPEGLFLYNFATLTITPSQEIPADQQIFFDYESEGENLGLALPVVDSPEIQIQLLHFSGHGVTKGFLADLEPVRQRLGGSQERHLQSLIAEELQRQKQGGEMDLERLSPLFQQYYDEVVKLRLDASGQSCAAGRLAIQTYISYKRQLQLLGLGDEVIEVDTGDLVTKVGATCLQEEYELCRDEHIIHRIIPAAIGVERQYQLVGAGSTEETFLSEQAKLLVENCLRFDLEFKSTTTGEITTAAGPQWADLRVSAVVPIRFNASTFEFSGEAPLIQEFVEFTGFCPAEGSALPAGGAATFQVFNLGWPSVPLPETKPGEVVTKEQLGQIKDLVLEFDPEQTSANWGYKRGPKDAYYYDSMWNAFGFTPAHFGELVGGGYAFKDWQILGDELFAKKEWQKVPAFPESGSFLLYHRPKQ